MHILYDMLDIEHLREACAMRTTLDLPEQVINEGLKVTHLKTKTELITLAVRELIRKYRLSPLKKFKSTVDLNINLNVLRNRG